MDYANREFIVNAMVDRIHKGISIKCYPSEYSFKKKMMILLCHHYDDKCMKCGSEERLEIDHIKPVSTHPELRLDPNNVQLLCRSCNAQKSNKNTIDYRGLNENNIVKF